MRILDKLHENSNSPSLDIPGKIGTPDQPPIPICGGTTRSQDAAAPMEILSRDLVFFKAGAEFGHRGMQSRVYAAKAEKGIYIVIAEEEPRFALLSPDCDFLTRLDTLVREYHLIRDNGHHSHTAGLPEDFGGSIDIRYASGEFISKSDNQSPIISQEADQAIRKTFLDAITSYPRIKLPDPSLIQKVEYREQGKDNYSLLTFSRNGETAKLSSENQYSTSGTIYKKEAQVPSSAFDRIIDDAKKYCLFGLGGVEKYHSSTLQISEQTLTYELSNGSKMVVPYFYGVLGGVSDVVFETERYLSGLL
jgi:hypothetical protein